MDLKEQYKKRINVYCRPNYPFAMSKSVKPWNLLYFLKTKFFAKKSWSWSWSAPSWSAPFLFLQQHLSAIVGDAIESTIRPMIAVSTSNFIDPAIVVGVLLI